jgi:hypothetical protein
MRLRGRFAALAALAASTAAAQVPAGGEFRVNASAAGSETVSTGRSIAILPAGDFVVVWQSAGPPVEVFGQRFDRAGAPVGGEFQVNTYTTGTQGSARLAALSDGGFAVAWHSVDQDGNGAGVFGQVHDPGGARRGAEFQVNVHTADAQYPFGIAAGPAGSFVVVWQSLGQDGSGYGVFSRRFDGGGLPVGGELRVNTYTTGHQWLPFVESARDGRFTVVWTSDVQDGSGQGVYGQRYDAAGSALGGEFRLSTYTAGSQALPKIALDAGGGAIAVWQSDQQDGSGYGVYGQRYAPSGVPVGAEFRVNDATTGRQAVPTVDIDEIGDFVVAFDAAPLGLTEIWARRFLADGTPVSGDFRVSTTPSLMFGANSQTSAVDAVGNFVVDWNLLSAASGWDVMGQRYGGLLPAGLRVDDAGNGVLEPGETNIPVRPSWRNVNGATQSFVGQISNPGGPPGGVPGISLLQAIYGSVANGAVGECSSCYTIFLPDPSPRPVVHWDATVDERILPMTLGQNKRWTLHVGSSFTDVSAASPFYRFIETLLHQGVTGGCGADTYCPTEATTREQMAVFVLVGKEGATYAPPACGAAPVFADVPASSPFCRWIEELARRGVVSGCGGGNYCPTSDVTREQMSVFVLRTLDPALNPPACGTPMFNDVPASGPFCRWIEELARRGVVTGCGGGNYCPTAAVTREQMGVFISVTFGLTLYGV